MAPELGKRNRHGPGRTRIIEPKSLPFREQKLVAVPRGREAHREGIETVRCFSRVEAKGSFPFLPTLAKVCYGKIDHKGTDRQPDAIELGQHLFGGAFLFGERRCS